MADAQGQVVLVSALVLRAFDGARGRMAELGPPVLPLSSVDQFSQTGQALVVAGAVCWLLACEWIAFVCLSPRYRDLALQTR